jgi:CRP-like cAMP-binding protein
VQTIATVIARSERPWFGELALWESKPRAATATCEEPTKLLVVHSHNFAKFLALCPEFRDIFSSGSTAYNIINMLKAKPKTKSLLQTERVLKDSKGREHRITVMAAEAVEAKRPAAPSAPSQDATEPKGAGAAAWARLSDKTTGEVAMADLSTRAAVRPDISPSRRSPRAPGRAQCDR